MIKIELGPSALNPHILVVEHSEDPEVRETIKRWIEEMMLAKKPVWAKNEHPGLIHWLRGVQYVLEHYDYYFSFRLLF